MATPSPRRRHSPAVYRRRRVVLVLTIALVAALVWLVVAQPWRSAAASPAASPTTSSSASASPTSPTSPSPSPTAEPSTEPTPPPDAVPSPSATDAAAPGATPEATPTAAACTARDLLVEAVTDHDTYAADQNPQFSIRLTNHGATDCALNVGTSAQVFTVTSGSDTWWRSTDCQSEPSDMIVLLAAGQTVTSATPLTWDRTRSAVDSCDSTDRPRAAGGGASYHLAVSIGGVPATQTAPFMLY